MRTSWLRLTCSTAARKYGSISFRGRVLCVRTRRCDCFTWPSWRTLESAGFLRIYLFQKILSIPQHRDRASFGWRSAATTHVCRVGEDKLLGDDLWPQQHSGRTKAG
jgi:hypothetical protein